MAIRVEHELHGRRRGRNLGLGLVLVAFVAVVFALTVAKVTALGPDAFAGDRLAVPGVGGEAAAPEAAAGGEGGG